MDRRGLRANAERILKQNDRGGSTVPSGRLYPHQWNWDSALIAIGLGHLDPRRAVRELELLLRGQWTDGMIPHILFNPDGADYEPGPRAWQTEGRGRAIETSSITQPPVAATAARMLLDASGGDKAIEATLRTVAEGLERWHVWFETTRSTVSGVPCIVHPWESGLDNAPRWDAALRRIEPGAISYQRKDDTIIEAAQRPTRGDYDRYFFLVNERARLGFAPPTRETVSFLVEDISMAAILCRAEEDLAALSAALGVPSDARARHGRLSGAILKRLYDPARARFHDYDVIGDARITQDHVGTLLPLYAGIAPPEAVERAVALLDDPASYGAPWPIPSVPLGDPAFEPRRYWRGPTWINVNWFIAEGLERHGQRDHGRRLRDRTLELLERSGFYEYFDPTTGEGLGAADFSWSAALCLDWLAS